ncbi:MAG: hypothetical protein NT069_26080, partial [Planctomycetota bacterium]|nr:hypothetical protein [Planctomycetota bacterium]
MICSSRHPNQGAWIVIGGILLMTLSGCGAPIAPGHASSLPEEKASISRIHRDPERRREPLVDRSSDTTLDVSAFNGMPKSHVAAVREYIDAVCAAIQAEPVRRKRFVHQDNPDSRRNVAFPDDANVVADRDMVVPLVV